jgi:hypothetical protein
MKYIDMFLSRGIALLFLIQINLGCSPPSSTENNIPPDEDRYKYMIYEEVDDPNPADPAKWESVSGSLNGSFGSSDIRYEKSVPPQINTIKTTWETFAWRGERVSTQLVLWSAANRGAVHFEWGILKSREGNEIPASNLKARFIRFVLTDEYAGGCTPHMVEGQDVSLASDPIDEVESLNHQMNTSRPVWVSIDVPEDIPPGIYSGDLIIKSSLGDNLAFNIELEVGNAVLPPPAEWSYHLDLWQNPSAVARYHNVEPWSEAHYAYLKPLIERLADAGQKVITTSIIDRPWNGQTQDAYRGMIDWRKKTDGTWQFDYAVFDEWVEFVEKCGITEQINCYTMIPWGNRFLYFDETKNIVDTLIARPGSQAYDAHWTPFLLDFSAHLKDKGWFEKTAIAMDEREVEDMQKAIELVARTVPGMKITLAGGYHPEIEEHLFDMCVASNQVIPEDVMLKRRADGRFSTFYTCCVEAFPNNFTFSPPAESTWQAWHAAHKGYSGFLRWAYMSWVLEPLKDSRFRNWPAGDTYFVYPEARTSIRFERLREGIQDFEKIRIIREKLRAKNTDQAKDMLKLLEEHLSKYKISALESTSAATMLLEGKNILEEITREDL